MRFTLVFGCSVVSHNSQGFSTAQIPQVPRTTQVSGKDLLIVIHSGTRATWASPPWMLLVVLLEEKRALESRTSATRCSDLEVTLVLTTHSHTSCRISSDHKRACYVSRSREGLRYRWAALVTATSFSYLAVDSPLQSYTPDVIKTSSIELFMPFISSLDLFTLPIHPCNSFIHSSLLLPPPPLCTEAQNILPLLPFLFPLPL